MLQNILLTMSIEHSVQVEHICGHDFAFVARKTSETFAFGQLMMMIFKAITVVIAGHILTNVYLILTIKAIKSLLTLAL
jgi:hypothetical protein